jgi:hypothetical protein
MSTLPKLIAEKFLTELGNADEISDEQVEALRELLKSDKKLKATDIEKVFSPPEETDL